MIHLQSKAAYRVDHWDCMLVYDGEGRDCSVTCLDWTDYLLLGDMTEALTTILCDTLGIESVTPFSCDAVVIKISLLCDTYGVLQVLSKCFWTDLARQRVQQSNWSKWCGLLLSLRAMAMQPFVKILCTDLGRAQQINSSGWCGLLSNYSREDDATFCRVTVLWRCNRLSLTLTVKQSTDQSVPKRN